MSNQQYRKDEPQPPSREARLAKARARIAVDSAKSAQHAEFLKTALKDMYLSHGGHEIDLQIEGMSLVIEEGNIYRREWIAYKTQMNEYLERRREREPYEPDKAALSGATMVSASRQLELLRERKNRLREDQEIDLGEAMQARDEAKKKSQPPEENRTPNETSAPKEAAPETEATPAKRDNRAATAAA
ncbi:hypothetical protein BAC2_00796 [uncultured bacterium]|nr:hypothetical protein BAC2_00796 [uncultured bacterium]